MEPAHEEEAALTPPLACLVGAIYRRSFVDMRRDLYAAALVVAAVTSSTPSALAERAEVARARQLYDDLRYDQAGQAFEAALALEGNGADDLGTIELHLGMLAGARNDEAAAEEHFRRALEVVPTVALPDGLPPKITRPFERARAFWGDGRLHIVHEPPDRWAAGDDATLELALADDRMRLVTGVRLLVWRDRDEAGARAYRQDGDGPFVFPVPADLLAQEGVVAYRIEVLGASEAILATLADEVTLVAATGSETTPEPARSVAGGHRVASPRPFYRTWWFWTVVGAAVAGIAVGTGVGLTAGGDGIDFGRPEVVR